MCAAVDSQRSDVERVTARDAARLKLTDVKTNRTRGPALASTRNCARLPVFVLVSSNALSVFYSTLALVLSATLSAVG